MCLLFLDNYLKFLKNNITMDNPKTRQTVLAVGAFLVATLGFVIYRSWKGSSKAEEDKAKAEDERREVEQQEALKKQATEFAKKEEADRLEAERLENERLEAEQQERKRV